ncbi:DNA-deoxyinosine glycosylase [Marinobacterium sp. xm-d-530]|uniref:DNA-deoxyinosine glycosylase n=1 Tax=Marinobacterium sp. xm-d-530 TaxID=2497747 RepID=UPI001569F11B|nr:DNA-deoxyinosine glycosylase [Marinobacterium sp. xm-d-530]NRQ02468.1 Uracil DNA glycosylase superfamily protein [Marinobacterium sp. xm-d-530]
MIDHSFSAVCNTSTKLLILGSLPGKKSIAEQQYYAHPRNALWPILCDWLQMPNSMSYEQKLAAALEGGIGFWDVVAEAERPGSLDSDIKSSTVHYNPIDQLIENLPKLKCIVLNGGAAMRLFKRAGFDQFAKAKGIDFFQLPSTSPAHASMTLDEKRVAWHSVLIDTLKE